jgi:hypothetical protein
MVLAMLAPPIAHVGHWSQGLLYLVPIVIVVATLYVMSRREDASEEADDRSR